MNKYRSHNCSELSENEINEMVYLSGWLHRKRDHGNLLFIDLRDHYGMTQCVIENNNDFFPLLEKTKSESVLKISGKVVKKSGDKTVSVLVTRQTTHPIYKKIIRVSKKYLAHDADNTIALGENVKIQETKPLSKSKSWVIIK